MKKFIHRIERILKSIKFYFRSFKQTPLPTEPESIIESIRQKKDFAYSFDCSYEESDVVLTIGITTYNCAKWIENTISTIKRQPYRKGVEILFVDNASTDNSVELIKEYASDLQFPYRIVANSTNGMAGYSRTKVVENAKGRFVLFLDGDDGLLTGAIDKALMIIEKAPDLDLIQLGPISFKKKETVLTDYRALFSIGGMPGGKIVNRKTWGNLCFPINCNFEDTVFPLDYYFRVKKAYVSSSNDYWIRPVNPESLSRKVSPSFLDHLRVVQFLYDKMKNKNEFTYQLLLRHFSLIAYERIKKFDFEIQLAAFAVMKEYVEKNRLLINKMSLRFKKIEKAFLSGNYYRWVATCYRYF